MSDADGLFTYSKAAGAMAGGSIVPARRARAGFRQFPGCSPTTRGRQLPERGGTVGSWTSRQVRRSDNRTIALSAASPSTDQISKKAAGSRRSKDAHLGQRENSFEGKIMRRFSYPTTLHQQLLHAEQPSANIDGQLAARDADDPVGSIVNDNRRAVEPNGRYEVRDGLRSWLRRPVRRQRVPRRQPDLADVE
jgi:hypothetical protein